MMVMGGGGGRLAGGWLAQGWWLTTVPLLRTRNKINRIAVQKAYKFNLLKVD